MNRIILLSVDDAWIKRSGETAGASGSAGAVTLRMTFDSAWDGTSKTVYFTDALGENSVKVLLGLDDLVSDNTYDVPVPGEAMTQPGQATVTVVGESAGRVITTQAARFRVLDAAIPPSAGNSQPITPDEAAQLQAQIDALEEIFVTNRQQAQDAAQQAESAKDAVQEAIDNIPPGAVLVINDLTTGGTAVALSAEQGKKLDETKADRQLSNLDTPQTALVNLGAGVRPNLLDNAHFIGGGSQQGGIQFPINQSDKTQFSNSRAFDRWNIANGELTIELDGVLIHQNLNSWFSQNINNPTRLAGETITFSMLVQAIDSGILRIAIGDSADPGNFGSGALLDTQFNAGEIKLLSVTATIQTGCSVVLSQNLSAEGMTYKCFAAKLEIGGTQTLASQKLDGEWDLLPQPENSYVTQLLTCQYYGVSFGKSLTWESVGFGEATSETSIKVVVPVPVALRIKPTATLTGALNLRSGSQVLECTSLFVDVFGSSTVLINASVTGATPGAAYDVFVPPGNFLTLDCSL